MKAPSGILKIALFWRVFAALLTGVLIALCFPPFGQAWLVWIGLIPLLLALWKGKKGWRNSALIGYLSGLTFWLINLKWLWTVSIPGALILAAYLAIYWAIFGAFAGCVANPWKPKNSSQNESHWQTRLKSLCIPLLLSCAWCGLEWLRGLVFTGFSWNGLGSTFHETLPLAQGADLIGVTGLSFLPLFFSASLLQVFGRFRQELLTGKLRPHFDITIAIALIIIAFAYGNWRMNTAFGKGKTNILRALIVQLDIPQIATQQLWSPEEIHTAYEEETLRALEGIDARNAERIKNLEEGWETPLELLDWVIWPESALPGALLTAPDGSQALYNNITQTLQLILKDREHLALIMGTIEREAEPYETSEGSYLSPTENSKTYNSLLIHSAGKTLNNYRKKHLVIYGEYFPLTEQIPWLREYLKKVTGSTSDQLGFGRGKSTDPLQIKAPWGGEISILPSICFEDTVSRVLRKFVRPQEAQIIVNITNDGWFQKSEAAAQHFANARFRAIELRRPMLRCANRGVNAAINPNGTLHDPITGTPRILLDKNGSPFLRGHLIANIAIPEEAPITLYARFGDWFSALGLAIMLLATTRMIFVSRRSQSKKS